MLPDSPPEKQEPCIHDITHYRRQGASMMITVPRSLRDSLNWEEGDLLFIQVERNCLHIISAQRVLVELRKLDGEETGSIN